MWQAFITLMVNIMLLLYENLGHNFIFALTVFTLGTRLLLWPLNLRQQRSTLRMQELQPQIQAIQKKYRDNQEMMMQEFNKIGYNPTEPLLGCLPLLLQMPIFLGLFQVINVMLEGTPQSLLSVVHRAYDFIDLNQLLPLENTFLWMNLAQPDPYFVLPLLVGGTMFLQQKLLMPTPPPADPNAKKKPEEENPMASMNQSMLYTMPLMFTMFSMSSPAGLSIYFFVSNLLGIVQGTITKRSMAAEKAESEMRRAERAKLASEMYSMEAIQEQQGEKVKKHKQKKQ